MSKSKEQQPPSGTSQSGRKRGFLVFAVPVLVGLVIIAAVVLYVSKKKGQEGQKEAVTTHAPAETSESKGDIKKLVGRWLRPDGGYILEISRIRANGRLDARYLNPRPINVSVAEVSAKGNDVKIFIELRDAGYPGSTYHLVYEPQRDILSGTYFQAALEQAFDVMFIRTTAQK